MYFTRVHTASRIEQSCPVHSPREDHTSLSWGGVAIGGGRDWGSLGAKPTLGIIGVGPQGSKHRGRTTGVEAQGSKHEARQGAIQRARDGCKPDAREQAIGAELPVYIYTRPVFTGLSTSNHNGSI